MIFIHHLIPGHHGGRVDRPGHGQQVTLHYLPAPWLCVHNVLDPGQHPVVDLLHGVPHVGGHLTWDHSHEHVAVDVIIVVIIIIVIVIIIVIIIVVIGRHVDNRVNSNQDKAEEA